MQHFHHSSIFFWKIQITQVWWPISTVVRFTRWSWRDHSIGLDSFLSRHVLHPKSGLVLLNIFSNGPDGPPWTIASGLMILLRWISWKRLLQDTTVYICAHYASMNIAHLLFLSSSWKSNHLLNGDGVNQLTNQYNYGLLPTRYSGWDDWRAFEEEPVMAHFVKMWPDCLGVFWSDERIVFSEDCVFCVRDVYALDDH